MPSACNVATIVVWLCSIDPIARNSLLCSKATTQPKTNNANAEVIAMPSACNMANIVVWLSSINPIACSSLLCSSEQAVMEAAHRSG